MKGHPDCIIIYVYVRTRQLSSPLFGFFIFFKLRRHSERQKGGGGCEGIYQIDG